MPTTDNAEHRSVTAHSPLVAQPRYHAASTGHVQHPNISQFDSASLSRLHFPVFLPILSSIDSPPHRVTNRLNETSRIGLFPGDPNGARSHENTNLDGVGETP